MSLLLRLLLLVCLVVPAMPGAIGPAHADPDAQQVTAEADQPPCHDDAPAQIASASDASTTQSHDCCDPDGAAVNHDCGCDCGCGGLVSTALPAHAANGNVQIASNDSGPAPPGGRTRLHSAPPVRPPIG